MKKQSSRARAQSTTPVRHQLEHEVPTVIHNPEQDLNALARWIHHAMLEPGRYLGWPLTVAGVVAVVAIALSFGSRRTPPEAALWKKIEAATTPAERVEIAKKDPKSPPATWTLLQAATAFYNQALTEMPAQKDEAATALKKALDLFDQVAKDAPHDSPQARLASIGKARTLEMRNELSRAIEQYQLVAKEWPGTPEAEEARHLAEALQDPQATQFYKDLYAYKPKEVTLPSEGSVNLPSTGPLTPPTAPGADPAPVLPPGIEAIPGMPQILDRQAPAPSPETKKDLPTDVFAPPKSGEAKSKK